MKDFGYSVCFIKYNIMFYNNVRTRKNSLVSYLLTLDLHHGTRPHLGIVAGAQLLDLKNRIMVLFFDAMQVLGALLLG